MAFVFVDGKLVTEDDQDDRLETFRRILKDRSDVHADWLKASQVAQTPLPESGLHGYSFIPGGLFDPADNRRAKMPCQNNGLSASGQSFSQAYARHVSPEQQAAETIAALKIEVQELRDDNDRLREMIGIMVQEKRTAAIVSRQAPVDPTNYNMGQSTPDVKPLTAGTKPDEGQETAAKPAIPLRALNAGAQSIGMRLL